MFPVSLVRGRPAVDTMPVIKTIYHPWAGEGSFRPLAYCRMAIMEREGVFIDLMCFERDPVVADRLLDGSCVAASFCFSPKKSRTCLTACAAPDGRLTVYSNEGQDAEGRPVLEGRCEIYGGSDEQGWYWGARFVLAADLLADCGSALPNAGEVFHGNVYRFLRAGSGAHLAAIAPAEGGFIFDCRNHADFVVCAY